MHFPRPVRAVIFDMDGLLFDTERLFFRAMVRTGEELGHPVTEALYLSLVGLPREATRERLCAHFGPEFALDAFDDDSRARFAALLDSELRLKAGVGELLDGLDRLGLPRAIATSSRRANVDHHLGHFDLTGRFDAIIAHGDYGRGKPDPEPYLTAAARLGVAPTDCLALEDSHNGVRSAAAAGTMTVMVPDMLAPTADIAALALHVAQDLHEVQRLLGA